MARPAAGGAVAVELRRWLDGIDAVLEGGATADVPCGSCTACCTSGQFVLISPDEHDALARIPAELRFPAPRMPDGFVLLGYDERGHCPMLADGRCSIYEHRPRTCRTYDCRVLAAAGVDAAGDGKPAIAEAVRRWRFESSAPDDAVELESIRRAADNLGQHGDDLPDDVRPLTATHVAVSAVRVRRAFRDGDEPSPAELAQLLDRQLYQTPGTSRARPSA